MKIKSILLSLALCGAFTLNAQQDHSAHAHEGQDHGENAGHAHESAKAGPNGGKVIHSVQPHFELFIQDDRKVRITFLGEDDKPITPAGQIVSGIGGSRSDPTKLSFTESNGVLLSHAPLPEGNTVPLIIRIQTKADSKVVTERININMAQCPTCAYKEYACVCDH